MSLKHFPLALRRPRGLFGWIGAGGATTVIVLCALGVLGMVRARLMESVYGLGGLWGLVASFWMIRIAPSNWRGFAVCVGGVTLLLVGFGTLVRVASLVGAPLLAAPFLAERPAGVES